MEEGLAQEEVAWSWVVQGGDSQGWKPEPLRTGRRAKRPPELVLQGSESYGPELSRQGADCQCLPLPDSARRGRERLF